MAETSAKWNASMKAYSHHSTEWVLVLNRRCNIMEMENVIFRMCTWCIIIYRISGQGTQTGPNIRVHRENHLHRPWQKLRLLCNLLHGKKDFSILVLVLKIQWNQMYSRVVHGWPNKISERLFEIFGSSKQRLVKIWERERDDHMKLEYMDDSH